ncbi:MAG: nickel pincer cofactor biosynthesis protein LarC [Magnetococcales bacterium]|nr:nickel pincer cofactor biosynthesis protein LarC [Magnetococcales bacterium]NGZ26733.1 nickel pincer cofactor biosynthesis protein LarC [Magnetococcales bacterium]
MKIHLELDSGIAGDMFMAACLDLGLDQVELETALRSIPGLPNWSLEVKRDRRGGMEGLHVDVVTPREHAHRLLGDITAMIDASAMDEVVKSKAKEIFGVLAQAEGIVHGLPADEVHFHEVGAVDAIIDICAAAFAWWRLGVTEVSATALVTGTGTVRCAHGVMNVPVPAVAELIRKFQIPLKPDPVEGEMVTPTGASILACLVNRFGPSGFTAIDAIGVGLGGRHLKGRANAIRILGQRSETSQSQGFQRDSVVLLSTNIDDMPPEWYGLLWERLFEMGALDVAVLPMTMKKGRPAVRVEVMVTPGDEYEMAKALLTHSTAIGVRIERMERLIQVRQKQSCQTPWGKVSYKESGGIRKPEYDDMARIAREQEWSLPKTYQAILPHILSQE